MFDDFSTEIQSDEKPETAQQEWQEELERDFETTFGNYFFTEENK